MTNHRHMPLHNQHMLRQDPLSYSIRDGAIYIPKEIILFFRLFALQKVCFCNKFVRFFVVVDKIESKLCIITLTKSKSLEKN